MDVGMLSTNPQPCRSIRSSEGPVRCGESGEMFRGGIALQDHRRTVHPPEFRCPVCKVAIKRRDNLYGATGHLRKKYPDVADRFCSPSTSKGSLDISTITQETTEQQQQGKTSDIEVDEEGDSQLGSATPFRLLYAFRRTLPLRKFAVETLSQRLDHTLEEVPFPVRVLFDFGLVTRNRASGRMYRPARK